MVGKIRGEVRVMLGFSIHSGAEREVLEVAFCVVGIFLERHSICMRVKDVGELSVPGLP